MIPSFFVDTNLRKHKAALRSMQTAVVQFSLGDDLARTALERGARSHGPSEMNIPRALYRHWMTSLIDAVRECDPEFSPEVERTWHEAATKAVDYFVAAAMDVDHKR